MAVRVYLCFLALLAGANALAAGPTPLEKVVSLLEDLKTEVEEEGKTEAGLYKTFSCWCKSETSKKSFSITSGKSNIYTLSADIADDTQTKKNKIKALGEEKAALEKNTLELSEAETQFAKDKAEYTAEEADLSKALQGLTDAIAAMSSTGGMSLIQEHAELKKTLQLAMVLNTIPASKQRAVTAFLQVDPEDPDYKYHSQGIIDICKELKDDYTKNLGDLNTEWGKTSKAFTETSGALKMKIGNNKFVIGQLKKTIDGLTTKIGGDRESLVSAEALLKDDEEFMKDMTDRCEARAADYDQRSAMRAGELEALSGALDVLTTKVKAAETANERAAFIQEKPKEVAKADVKAATPKKEAPVKSPSFLQEVSVKRHSSFLARAGMTQEARVQQALALLKDRSHKIGSMSLAALVSKAASDPFKKVKGLIQALIERLLAESQAEATKKGFCDTELGKAEHDRDARFQEAMDLNSELMSLEAKRDALSAEIDELTSDIKDEKFALKSATDDRKEEKKENLETIKTAKEGFEAVNEALTILKTFYKQAAKAALVQVKASPLAEVADANVAPEGSYKGSQDSSKAIFALLETISSDFDRTIRTTTTAEDKAHRAYVAYMQTAESSIAGKTTKKDLDTADLKTTNDSINTKMDDLQTATDLLDKALEELEDLKPVCIDTGMSYAERVKKREDEIDALKSALCILDEDGVEEMCK